MSYFHNRFRPSSLIRTMFVHTARRRAVTARRGAAAVFGLVLSTALVVLMAFTIDMGYIGVARSETKRAADAAAISSCWELFDGHVAQLSTSEIESNVATIANQAASFNKIHKQSPSVSADGSDVQLGYYDFSSPDQLVTSNAPEYNAVRVTLRREAATNGEVPLFFGGVTGRYTQAVSATATAAMVKTVSGFDLSGSDGGTLDILPIALDEPTWEAVLRGETPNNYRFSNGQVSSGTDEFHECNLYPQGTGLPGNRGTVDIGGSNNSTSDISRQILEGISQQDLADLGHDLCFDSGDTLRLNGDTGISAGIKDELASIIGETRIIPIYSHAAGNGNNAYFTIVRWEGVRILDVKLTGPMKKKHLTIQPAHVIARHAVVTEPTTAVSTYLYAPVMLVQ